MCLRIFLRRFLMTLPTKAPHYNRRREILVRNAEVKRTAALTPAGSLRPGDARSSQSVASLAEPDVQAMRPRQKTQHRASSHAELAQ